MQWQVMHISNINALLVSLKRQQFSQNMLGNKLYFLRCLAKSEL